MAPAAVAEAIRLHPKDNVAVAVRDLPAGREILVGSHRLALSQAIRLGHKIALAAIPRGQRVWKYGQSIGVTTEAVVSGDWKYTPRAIAAMTPSAVSAGCAWSQA